MTKICFHQYERDETKKNGREFVLLKLVTHKRFLFKALLTIPPL